MSDPLYRRELLRLAADAHGAGRLLSADCEGSAYNPACGDRVTMTVTLDHEGRIAALAHETRACVLAQASASILGRDARALNRADIDALRRAVEAMLKDQGEAPDAPFDSYAVFDGVAGHTARHTCVLLPINALLKALEEPEPGSEAV